MIFIVCDYSGMAKRYYTSEDVRGALLDKLGTCTQADICRESGVKAQNISQMVKGAPIGGKVLTWLGYKRVNGIYERSK